MKELSLRNPFKSPIYYTPSVDSTMSAARTALGSFPANGTVLVAGQQTSGRGRMKGRGWHAAQGHGLLCTIVFLRELIKVPVSSLPIRIALALSRMLNKQFEMVPKIKWPNDVLVHEKKISGILCESTRTYVYAGLGLNVAQESFPQDMRTPATSVLLESGLKVEPLELLPPLLEELYPVLNVVQLPILVRPWLYRLDDEIAVSEGDPEKEKKVSGIVTGIGESGELRLLQKSGKIRSIYSGE